MKEMTPTEIIMKLIGPIEPVGDSYIDDVRFENLKNLCNLVEDLVTEIDGLAYRNRYSQEFSVKRSSEYIVKFLSNNLGISQNN